MKRGRINGQLAVSRSLGDFQYKNEKNLEQSEQMVSAVPDVKVIKRSLAKDQFLVLVSGGVYQAINDQDMCSFISDMIADKYEISEISAKLLDYCLMHESRENMSVIICKFPAASKMKSGAFKSVQAMRGGWDRCASSPTASGLDLSGVECRSRPSPPPGVTGRGRMGRRSSLNSYLQQGSSPKNVSQSRRLRYKTPPYGELNSEGHKMSEKGSRHCDKILLMKKDDVCRWSDSEVVSKFLGPCNLSCYSSSFLEEGVDGSLLLELTDKDFEDELMVQSADARFIRMAVNYISQVH